MEGRNFGKTFAMSVIFLSEYAQYLIYISKMQKKIKFFVFEIIAYEYNAVNLVY